MARNSAQAALDILQERGIVTELTGRERSRAFACLPVLRAIFGGALRLGSRPPQQEKSNEG
jgi:hypothetical protein